MPNADQTYLQADQPEGVPPLELTGERTLRCFQDTVDGEHMQADRHPAA